MSDIWEFRGKGVAPQHVGIFTLDGNDDNKPALKACLEAAQDHGHASGYKVATYQPDKDTIGLFKDWDALQDFAWRNPEIKRMQYYRAD